MRNKNPQLTKVQDEAIKLLVAISESTSIDDKMPGLCPATGTEFSAEVQSVQ